MSVILLQKQKNKHSMKNYFNKAFLCISLLLLSSIVYAQSGESVKIPLERKQQGEVNNNELPKRDFDIYSILPTVLYNGADDLMTITSQYVTFESVAYYILDELGFVQQQGEMTLRKGDEVEVNFPQLSAGLYKIVLNFCGECFQGEFDVE